MRFSTACWMVAGRASAESASPRAKASAPLSSFAIPPESTSERTSSLVKNGFPSVASRRRCARESVTREVPATDSTSARCSEAEKGGSVRDRKRGSSAKESSMRVSG